MSKEIGLPLITWKTDGGCFDPKLGTFRYNDLGEFSAYVITKDQAETILEALKYIISRIDEHPACPGIDVTPIIQAIEIMTGEKK